MQKQMDTIPTGGIYHLFAFKLEAGASALRILQVMTLMRTVIQPHTHQIAVWLCNLTLIAMP